MTWNKSAKMNWIYKNVLLYPCVVVSKLWKQALYLVTLVGTEQSRVVSLLHNDECYPRLISNLQFHAGFTNGAQFMSQDRCKLPLTHTVAVVDDARRLEVRSSIELHQ